MNPKKILLVEDEHVIQVLCKRLLNQPEYTLQTTDSVQEAIRRVQAEPLDLLITDLRLPDGDGTEVIQALQKVRPACKIIIITGSPTPEERFRRVDNVQAEYINKPFEVEILMTAVQKALGS